MSEPSAFPLPCLTLTHGDWRCLVADPRQDPLALGSRYIQGGYIAAVHYAERKLTGRAASGWNPYQGQGLPEAFDEPFGYSSARVGERYLRIGAGQVLRTNNERHGCPPLTNPALWRLLNQSPESCSWRTDDHLRIGGAEHGYRLDREVWLDARGLHSRSRLTLSCPWSHPVVWFAHPFLSHQDGSGTTVQLPAQAVVDGHRRRRWQPGPEGGFAVATGVWGERAEVSADLDPRLGGGRLSLSVDRPLDKVVLWANQRTAAPEPYLARAWANGETAEWTITYRFTATPPSGA